MSNQQNFFQSTTQVETQTDISVLPPGQIQVSDITCLQSLAFQTAEDNKTMMHIYYVSSGFLQ